MPNVRKIRAVLFDLGGTLVKTTNVCEIHQKILDIHGVTITLDKIVEAHSANQKELDVEEMARLGEEYWIRWNLKMLDRLGIKERKEFLARKIDELWWDYAELETYPEVEDTLKCLSSRGIKTGMITNGTEKDYKQILQKLNLTHYFDVVVGIDACKKGKPHKEIFLYALKKIHVKPEEAIFVGDSIKHDYEGAYKAGLKPLLIDRKENAPPNVESISNLTQVLQYV